MLNCVHSVFCFILLTRRFLHSNTNIPFIEFISVGSLFVRLIFLHYIQQMWSYSTLADSVILKWLWVWYYIVSLSNRCNGCFIHWRWNSILGASSFRILTYFRWDKQAGSKVERNLIWTLDNYNDRDLDANLYSITDLTGCDLKGFKGHFFILPWL